MAARARGNPQTALWSHVRWAVAQNFVDQWILIAFGTLGGFAVLLVLMSDTGRPSMMRAFACLLAPSLAISLLIALDGLADAFIRAAQIGRTTGAAKLDR